MRSRIKKLEAVQFTKMRRLELDEPMPREVCENLHRVYGEPGEAVDYGITLRDGYEALEEVYGKEAGGTVVTAPEAPALADPISNGDSQVSDANLLSS